MGAFFLQRINDHLQYLTRLNATLAGRGDFRGGDHHDCVLGRWIESTGAAEAAGAGPEAASLFAQMLDPHEQFHVAGGRALVLREAGRHDEMQRAVTQLHRLSGELVDLLLGLDRLASGKA